MSGLLEDFIVAEGIGPGERLPPERDLSLKLGLPRTALRRQLAKLEQDGRLIRHVGRGTFLADDRLRSAQKSSFKQQKLVVRTYPAEVFEARLIVEPKAAAIAALRATPYDIEEMRKAIELGSIAFNFIDFENCDALFHRLIVQAARNNLLNNIYESIHAVRSGRLWGRMKEVSLTTDRMARYAAQHQEIYQAILDRDGRHAETIMFQHITDSRHAILGDPSP
ncbi:FCD domain-containing protein [Jiella sp. MQZ9-1]|uniref:FadR family transcriptional regulator n=1 Tax=Jiella flava TaxID=2816857 RepID=A0A939FV90_9HYPH|nr:FCD domain-containing protein [Jiella flava]MBO0661426.1 FadR family transcriptional regulator [Jiella flava]MCD2470069.1 FCD domain-containing protein [Jiella flava]